MNIQVNLYSFNPTFNSRLTKQQKLNLDKTLSNLLETDLDLNGYVKNTGLTVNAICKWFLNSQGITAAKFFKNKHSQQLKKELTEFYNKNTPVEDVAQHYNRSKNWVTRQYILLGIKDSNAIVDNNLKNSIPQMVKEGHSIAAIAKKNKCSYNKAKKAVTEELGDSIVNYRHRHSIRIKHLDSKKYSSIREMLENDFAEGKTITEVAKLHGMTKARVCNLRDMFNLKTQKERAIERMKEMVPSLMKANIRLKEMAKIIGGVSAGTIGRYIKKINNGKTYLEFRLGK